MPFNFDTSAAEAASALASSISGKNVLITGASPKSLGAEAARVIAKNGAGLVVLAGRNRGNLEETEKAIKSETPDANVRLLDIDLQDFESVRRAAKEVQGYAEPIHVLINNAATMATPYRKSPSGIESQFAGNHLGHFLFTNLILSKLASHGSDRPRVVNVSSGGHQNSGIRFEDLNFKEGETYQPWVAYGQSKTANILFTRSLASKHPHLLSFSLHPGVIQTNLGRDLTPEALQYLHDLGITPDKFRYKTLGQGAATHVVAAFDPRVEGENGGYMQDCGVDEGACAEHARDMEAAERLWKVSEELVGETF